MTMDDALHLKQTKAFIEENPSSIVIFRRPKVSTPSGGWRYGPPNPPLTPQVMRKVGSSRLAATTMRTTADGREVIPTATLIAMPDADIAKGDIFTLDGNDFEVINTDNENPPWRMQAEVTEYG